jgi:hypothetical protein
MRDAQVVQLLKKHMGEMQEWYGEKLADQKKSIADTHNLAVHTNLRLDALMDCLENRPRWRLWGLPTPFAMKLTSMEIEARYHVLVAEFVEKLRKRDEDKSRKTRSALVSAGVGEDGSALAVPDLQIAKPDPEAVNTIG